MGTGVIAAVAIFDPCCGCYFQILVVATLAVLAVGVVVNNGVALMIVLVVNTAFAVTGLFLFLFLLLLLPLLLLSL